MHANKGEVVAPFNQTKKLAISKDSKRVTHRQT